MVYARRIEAARELAEQYSAHATDDFDVSSVGVTRSRSPVPPGRTGPVGPAAAAAGKPCCWRNRWHSNDRRAADGRGHRRNRRSHSAHADVALHLTDPAVPGSNAGFRRLRRARSMDLRSVPAGQPVRNAVALAARALWMSACTCSTCSMRRGTDPLDLGRGDPHEGFNDCCTVHEGGAVSDAAISAVVPWLRLGSARCSALPARNAPQVSEVTRTLEVRPVIAGAFAEVVSQVSRTTERPRGLFLSAVSAFQAADWRARAVEGPGSLAAFPHERPRILRRETAGLVSR